MVDRADGAVRVLDTRTGDIRPPLVLFNGRGRHPGYGIGYHDRDDQPASCRLT